MTEPYIDELPQTAGEAGFMLLTVVVMVALVLIALAVAAPVVARQLQRDREVESIHRANEYVRAIQLYQRKFPNQYPPSIKALEGTNNLRFLRHQYVDPLTGKADWRLIHQGEQKTKIHVFFGQELAGLSAGLGAAAGLQSGGTAGTAGTSSTSTIGATSPLASGFSRRCDCRGGAGEEWGFYQPAEWADDVRHVGVLVRPSDRTAEKVRKCNRGRDFLGVGEWVRAEYFRAAEWDDGGFWGYGKQWSNGSDGAGFAVWDFAVLGCGRAQGIVPRGTILFSVG
jgi:type II secretory pathway pseudopilin PulG